MKPEDLNLFDVIERDEPRWDDDVLKSVRYRVEFDTEGRGDGWYLVRRGEYGTFINSMRLDQVDLSNFRKVGPRNPFGPSDDAFKAQYEWVCRVMAGREGGASQ